MIRAKLKNLLLDIPETVKEITIGQYVALREAAGSDELTITSIISGKPLELLMAVTYSPLEMIHISTLANNLTLDINRYFAPENISERTKKPKQVIVGDVTIKVPDGLLKSAYWATRKAVMLIEKEVERNTENGSGFDLTPKYIELLAHYLYCPYTDMKYNENRADEFQEIIKDLPMTDAIELGNFILLSPKASWKESINPWGWSQLLTSLQRMYPFLKSSGRYRR